MKNSQIQLQEPLKSEYPNYTSRKANNLPFYEDLHFMWRQLPETMKAPNSVYIKKETTIQRMGRLLNNYILIKNSFNKINN